MCDYLISCEMYIFLLSSYEFNVWNLGKNFFTYFYPELTSIRSYFLYMVLPKS